MSGTRALRSPLTLAILTLLAERDRHPYEMRQVLAERHIERVVKLRGGSLYDAIGRLERAGLVEKVGTGRAGARPERTIYTITADGRAHVESLLEEFLAEPVAEYPRFVAGLAHLAVLSPDRVARLLRRRADLVEAEAARTDALLATDGAGLSRVVLLEEEYAQVLRRAEVDWLRSVVSDLEAGKLPWPTASEAPAEGGGEP